MSKELPDGLLHQSQGPQKRNTRRKNRDEDGLLQRRVISGTSRCPPYYSTGLQNIPSIQPTTVHQGIGDRGVMFNQIPRDGRLFHDLRVYLSGTCRALLNEYDLYIYGKKIKRGLNVVFPNVLDDDDLCLHGRIDFSSEDGQRTLHEIKELLLTVFKDPGSQSYVQEYFQSLYADINLLGLWVTRKSDNNKITAVVLFTLPPKDQKFFYIHWWSTDRKDESRGLGATILKLVCGLQMQMHNDINLLVFADTDSPSLLNHYKSGGFIVPPEDNALVQDYVAKIYREEYDSSPYLTPLILQGKFFQEDKEMSSEAIKIILENYGKKEFIKLILKPSLI